MANAPTPDSILPQLGVVRHVAHERLPAQTDNRHQHADAGTANNGDFTGQWITAANTAISRSLPEPIIAINILSRCVDLRVNVPLTGTRPSRFHLASHAGYFFHNNALNLKT